VDDVDGLKEKWGLHPAQGDATTVPELQTPPEDMCKLSNTNASEILNAKRASAATGVGNQWARRAAERRAQCAAGCACLKPGGAGPFKLPRLQ
jgi:nardilysin